MPKEAFSKLIAERYEPVLASFPTNFENQIVQVYIFFRKAEHLTCSKSRVKNRQSDKVRAPCPSRRAEKPRKFNRSERN